ncbi:MAG TPA: hypothetical protein VNL14_16625 [Candidatus Acidoferrales bacterium]|nr:hypothetical protein [Candidatus Acidoferrales bacterium]
MMIHEIIHHMVVGGYAKYERPEYPGMDWYDVDPDAMYPAALDYLRALHSGEEQTADPEILNEITKIKLHNLPADTFDIAKLPAGRVGGRALERYHVLECARLVFTALLRRANGRAIGIHIVRKGNWRLI